MAYRGLSEHFRPGSHFLDDFNSERNNHAHLPTTIASKLVKIINSYEHGEVVFDKLFSKHFRRNQLGDIWRVLNDEDRNFTIDNRSSPYGFHGFEVIRVHTKLALCSFHCRQGRDGRNKKCDGQCGALHLCRTFLLKSNEACHFGRKGKCMFGHDFFSQHNLHLLRENNLDGLNEHELRALFQLPLSRCKTTTPQVCKYYNNDRQKCTNRHCTSLHICSQFILQEQHKNCKKNHSFQDDQVRKTLDLFEIGGKDWRKNEVFEIISRFHSLEQSADGNQEMNSDYSDNESNYSESSSFSNYSGSRQITHHLDHDRSQSTCDGCKSLKQELDALKLEMTQKVMSLERDFALLKSEVQSLRKNNLDKLSELELRTLFRLPLSCCKMTTPQICKYYNNDRQKCTKRHCTSLHICSQFILQEQHQNCKKYHSFQDDQVRKTLDLFDIGGSKWKKIYAF